MRLFILIEKYRYMQCGPFQINEPNTSVPLLFICTFSPTPASAAPPPSSGSWPRTPGTAGGIRSCGAETTKRSFAPGSKTMPGPFFLFSKSHFLSSRSSHALAPLPSASSGSSSGGRRDQGGGGEKPQTSCGEIPAVFEWLF